MSNTQVGRRGACYTLLPLRGGVQLRRLECCATYRNFLFVGVSDGFDLTLIGYREMYRRWDFTSLQNVTFPSGKPPTQLAVLAELQIVVALSDGILYVYTCKLPNEQHAAPSSEYISQQPLCTIPNIKDCSYFTIKKQDGVYTLAAVLKRRIAICEWRSGHFDTVNDLQLPPEAPLNVLWSGNGLLLCFQKEYSVLIPETGKPTKTFEPRAQPGACYLQGFGENLVLLKEAFGAKLRKDGNPASRSGVQWNSHPKAMLYSHPYLLSLHGSSIEIHTPHSGGGRQMSFCQIMNLAHADKFNTPNYVDYDAPNPTVRTEDPATPMARDAVVILSSDGTMRMMQLIPIDQQISTLFKEGQFDEAMHLCQLCTNEVNETLRVQLILQHGNYLFGRGEYDQTVAKFNGARVDPRYLISYFHGFMPNVVRDRWRPPVAIADQHVLSEVEVTRQMAALTTLMSYIEPFRTQPPPDHRSPIREATLQSASDRTLMLAAVDTALLHCLALLRLDTGGLLTKPNYVVLESAERRLKEQNDFASLGLLYLTLRDPKELVTLLEQLRNFAVHGSSDSVTASTDHVSLKGAPVGKAIEALVNYKKIRPEQYYAYDECSRLIKSLGQQVESNESLLRRLMAVTTSVYVLKQLDGDNVEHEAMLDNFTPWLLDSLPASYAVAIFVKHPSDAGNPLKPHKVAEFLYRNSNACNEYLAAILADDPDSKDAELHDKRIGALVNLIAAEQTSQHDYVGELAAFMRSSNKYNAASANVLIEGAQNKANPLLQKRLVIPRTIALQRQKLHEDAIKLLLAHGMATEAENYARDVNRESRATGKRDDAFRHLIRAYIRPSSGSADVTAALKIVKTNPTIDMVAALQELPDHVSAAQLADVVQSALRTSQADLRHKQLAKNLLNTRVRTLQCQAAAEKLPSFVVHPDQRCTVCKAGFKKTNIVRFPNETVVHQSCAPDLTVCPVTGTDFRRNIDLL